MRRAAIVMFAMIETFLAPRCSRGSLNHRYGLSIGGRGRLGNGAVVESARVLSNLRLNNAEKRQMTALRGYYRLTLISSTPRV